MKPRWRIRYCDGNREAWMLVQLRDDGTESDFSYRTSLSLDDLLRDRRPIPGETVELVWP